MLVLDRAREFDYVVVGRIAFTAETPVTDTALAAFVWSYGMLLHNWNPSTGLMRDKARDASGEFDAIQATGGLAAATAVAERLGIIRRSDAVAIVHTVRSRLMDGLPRFRGLWPHWVQEDESGDFEIVAGTEWSSVDTVIAVLGLLDAQSALGLDSSATEDMIRAIEWAPLVTGNGISHGYDYAGGLIPYAWDTFGGESWLVELAYAAATGGIAPLEYSAPPTANGSGFIDELAWLLVLPPSRTDYWGTDWPAYRLEAFEEQAAYFSGRDLNSCFSQRNWFGLSAAEVPSPSAVPKDSLYQAFGVGGRFSPANDGTGLLGSSVVVPHYSAMAASLNPSRSVWMWDQLIDLGLFSPLNNVESLAFGVGSDCSSEHLEWNSLKGSWNLTLQTLGWGRYLEERNGQIPILWQAMKANPFLNHGYLLLAPNEPTPAEYSGDTRESVAMMLTRLQNKCAGEPLHRWSLPGTYRYSSGITFIQTSDERIPNSGGCPYMPWGNPGDPPKTGGYSCFLDNSFPPGCAYLTQSGFKQVSTPWGRLQALTITGSQEYNIFTSNLSNPHGTLHIYEWYVCGVGVFRLKVHHEGSYQGRNFEEGLNFELIQYTPAG